MKDGKVERKMTFCSAQSKASLKLPCGYARLGKFGYAHCAWHIRLRLTLVSGIMAGRTGGPTGILGF